MGIRQNRFEENQFFLGGLYSVLLKVCSVASNNCGKVRCSTFLLSLLNMEEDRIGIGVGMISVRPVDDAGDFCEEVGFKRVTLITLSIGDSVNDVVSLCRLILDL